MAGKDNNIIVGNNVNIISMQNSFEQSESKSSKGIGSAQISDTEKFFGYMRNESQSSSQGVEQARSQVGSLEGNVNIKAGNQYTQQAADVVAGKDINITANPHREAVKNSLDAYAKDKSEVNGINTPALKGYFMFNAVDGECEGIDFPVGYDGATTSGDYYRHLMPTIYATIDDFPDDLKKLIVVSDSIDFEVDRVISNDSIDRAFPKLYSL